MGIDIKQPKKPEIYIDNVENEYGKIYNLS